MCVGFRAGAREIIAPAFDPFTHVCVFVCVGVKEGLIYNVSSEIHIVYYVIATEGKTL